MTARRKVTVIGIAGDSGAGKSTFVAELRALIGEERVTTISIDDYHSLDRFERSRIGVTALHPWKANNLGLLIEHVWQLKAGRAIEKPIYDHSDGRIKGPEIVVPRDIVLLEGLHILYLEKLREALDLKIYFDTDIRLRVRWKVRRDASTRGYTEAEVLEEIERRKPDVQNYIEPQKAYADLVVQYIPDDDRPPTPDDPEPIKVRIAERLNGDKRRLVKWLSLGARFGLIEAVHYHDKIVGEEMEIADIGGRTPMESMLALLEMISDNHHLKEKMNETHYTPIKVTQYLIASMIIELAYGRDLQLYPSAGAPKTAQAN
ncbi:phosphoribulokinase [Hydrogenibacillus schlegelii]|uniref:phosphoribulokinase n=1 Tax=Hydrogenibacillus schlegelii TaxID=1484 RepID=A0A132MG69_HYDSH|nr:phosphoribulokinase [Hydrogenibacillus schlegelii]KWW96828.1 phosphoribulokinase [Hydrogenibacillus schlegelii]MBT9281407.1 phosphoribulokinase [Hydrogenibacillus schlegelii]OAR04739.1 phosphoribulokinase [Hydrogenibacillus schlegelii]PTQ54995.1 MAG: Phosphoribulokinase [Hydrogenibacillus schlegelii]